MSLSVRIKTVTSIALYTFLNRLHITLTFFLLHKNLISILKHNMYNTENYFYYAENITAHKKLKEELNSDRMFVVQMSEPTTHKKFILNYPY